MANRSRSRAWPVAAALLLGATAGASAIFFLPWRFEKSLMDKKSVNTPTEIPPETGRADEESGTVPGKAETAANAVQSARDGQETPAGGEARTVETREPERVQAGANDGLLDLLTGEARLVTDRLARENAELKAQAAELAERNRALGGRLAEAMAALDRDAVRRLPEAEAGAAENPPTEARIADVNRDLGLVAIDQGRRDGVRHGLTLTVFRGRRKVAKVRVVDVRERIAGAAVEEAAAGDYPQSGDRAVLVRPSGSEGK